VCVDFWHACRCVRVLSQRSMSSPDAATWTCYLCQSVNLYEYCSNSKPYCGVSNAKFPMNPPEDGALPSCGCRCNAIAPLAAPEGDPFLLMVPDVDEDSESSMDVDVAEDKDPELTQLLRLVKQMRDRSAAECVAANARTAVVREEAEAAIQVVREELRVAVGHIAYAEKLRLLKKEGKKIRTEKMKKIWLSSAVGKAAVARRILEAGRG
jgi:hypothetical protein